MTSLEEWSAEARHLLWAKGRLVPLLARPLVNRFDIGIGHGRTLCVQLVCGWKGGGGEEIEEVGVGLERWVWRGGCGEVGLGLERWVL